ncbi:MAG: LOG family protein [Deltaproteobacteria bacterium]|nr:LOG family protein [Deltaproteobacteria bacterium]
MKKDNEFVINEESKIQSSDFRTEADYSHLTKQQKKVMRKHLDERLTVLHNRVRVVESELHKLENHFYRACIFGSARIKPENKIYKDVTLLAKMLAAEGIDILTGGGPGLMEAANIGAQQGKEEGDTKIRSYGLSIELEFEPLPNPHLDVKRHHHKFSSRLDDFMRLSNSVICTPGGVGTVLELVFTWQLIQVRHLPPRPIILMDRGFWAGFMEWLRDYPVARKLINPGDLDVIQIVDTPEEVHAIIKEHYGNFLSQRQEQQNAS